MKVFIQFNQPDQKAAMQQTDLQIKFSDLINRMFNFIATSFFIIFTIVRTLKSNKIELVISVIDNIIVQQPLPEANEKVLYC